MSATSAGRRPHILLVEDHADSRLMTARLLRREGYVVSEADGFASALAIARRTAYDLLITDLHFPDGNGWDLFQRLNPNGSLHAIVVSGSVPLDEVPPVSGLCTFLTKPISFDKLLAAIAQCHPDASTASTG